VKAVPPHRLRGKAYKEWTWSQHHAGTGMPKLRLSGSRSGTAFFTIRPSLTGASIYNSSTRQHLNVGAYQAPASGQWGNAGATPSPARPVQSQLVSRAHFPPHTKFNLIAARRHQPAESRCHLGWVTTINSTQFGIPAGVNPMRSLQTTIRLRF